jgi:predicted RNase H-like HicB family nuclease
MIKVMYRAEIFPEGDCYVGLCRELDVSSFGDSPEDAANSLQEAMELFLEGCEELGTLDEILEESGFQRINGVWELGERITQDKVATVR